MLCEIKFVGAFQLSIIFIAYFNSMNFKALFNGSFRIVIRCAPSLINRLS